MNSKPQKEKRFTKEKVKKVMPKIIGFVVIVAISAAFSNVNFAQVGHDFFMKFFDFALQEDENEGQYLYTLPPSEERAEMEREAAGVDGEDGAAENEPQTDAPNAEATESPLAAQPAGEAD